MKTLPFFCATTILDIHTVGSVTGLTIYLSAMVPNSALTMFYSATGSLCGGLITGTTSGFI